MAGLDAHLEPLGSVKSLAGYDAFVIGSAAYTFHRDYRVRRAVPDG